MPNSIYEAVSSENFTLLNTLLVSGDLSGLHFKDFESNTPLHIAVRLNRLDLARLLLAAGAAVNAANDELRTPLFLAAEAGFGDLVQLLVDAGADVNFTDYFMTTPLSVASTIGHLEVVELLLSYSANTSKLDGDDRSALYYAAQNNHLDIAKLLLAAGADINGEAGGEAPVKAAAAGGRADVVRYLVDNGARIQNVQAVHTAAGAGRAGMVRLLVGAGADVNEVDTDGNTPLHFAVMKDEVETVHAVLEAGANVKAVDKRGQTAVFVCLSSFSANVQRVLEMLLRKDAKVDISTSNGQTMIETWLETQSVVNYSQKIWRDVYYMLTDAGATVDGATATISPLVPSDIIRAIVPEDTHFWLAANNDAPMLAAELAGGLDPNMKTENGMTLLHWACAGDAPEGVQLLLDAGADKEAGDPKPIFYSMHESSDCLKHLLHAGVDVNQVFNDCSPINFALAANSPACVTALVGAGAWVTEDEVSGTFTPLEASLIMVYNPYQAIRALVLAAGSAKMLNCTVEWMQPLLWAIQSKKFELLTTLVESLREAGAGQHVEAAIKEALEFAEELGKEGGKRGEYEQEIEYLKKYVDF